MTKNKKVEYADQIAQDKLDQMMSNDEKWAELQELQDEVMSLDEVRFAME